MYPCHSQIMAMAAIVFFAEVPEQQRHYDPVLDSLYLMASSRFRLYLFFQRSFAVSILCPFFNPEAPFDGIPLYMVYPEAAPTQPSPPASMEFDSIEASSSFSSAPSSGGSGHLLSGPRTSGILANDFHTPSWISTVCRTFWKTNRLLYGLASVPFIEWPSFEAMCYLGHRHRCRFLLPSHILIGVPAWTLLSYKVYVNYSLQLPLVHV